MKIEKNIPIPGKDTPEVNSINQYKYECFLVMENMNIGDSILVDRNYYTVKYWFHHSGQIKRRIEKYLLEKMKPNWVFESKKDNKKTRIWRVA